MTRKPFTLIELLVVISIISLLISILLPALAAARGAARNSVCLTNQHQIALGFAMYADDFKGRTVPYKSVYSGGTQANWASILGFFKYVPAPSRYGPFANWTYPKLDPLTKSPFVCPDAKPEAWGGDPISHTDERGARRWEQGYTPPGWHPALGQRFQPDLCYGINGDDDTRYDRTPFRSYDDRYNRPTPLVTDVPKPSKTVAIFDGVYTPWLSAVGANYINARHLSHRTTNVLHCDGHASSIPISELPSDNTNLWSLPLLKDDSPQPYWWTWQ